MSSPARAPYRVHLTASPNGRRNSGKSREKSPLSSRRRLRVLWTRAAFAWRRNAYKPCAHYVNVRLLHRNKYDFWQTTWKTNVNTSCSWCRWNERERRRAKRGKRNGPNSGRQDRPLGKNGYQVGNRGRPERGNGLERNGNRKSSVDHKRKSLETNGSIPFRATFSYRRNY